MGVLPWTGGAVLGFEPAGYAYGDFTSWLIHGLHAECHARFGIRPNRWGLLEPSLPIWVRQ